MKDSTKQLIEENGYYMWEEKRELGYHRMRFQKRIWNAEKLGIPLCVCNDKVFVNLDYSHFTFHNSGGPVSSKSFQISVCHERPDGEWCDFKIYSLTEEQIVNGLQKYEQDILSTWKLFYEQGWQRA